MPVVDTAGQHEPETLYRLDGLMARVMDQDVLPVLLTLRVMQPPSESGRLLFAWPGVGVRKPKGPPVGIDLLVSHGNNWVWAFEVKKNAARLEHEQLDKLITASGELHARPSIAALEGDFPDQFVEKVKRAGGHVFTAKQLLA
jgi:hypothetical protein